MKMKYIFYFTLLFIFSQFTNFAYSNDLATIKQNVETHIQRHIDDLFYNSKIPIWEKIIIGTKKKKYDEVKSMLQVSSNIKVGEDSKKAKILFYKYRAMVECIINKENKLLGTMLKELDFNPTITVYPFNKFNQAMAVLDIERQIEQISPLLEEELGITPNIIRYRYLNTCDMDNSEEINFQNTYTNLSLFTVAAMLNNKEALNLLYNYTNDNYKKEYIKSSLILLNEIDFINFNYWKNIDKCEIYDRIKNFAIEKDLLTALEIAECKPIIIYPN